MPWANNPQAYGLKGRGKPELRDQPTPEILSRTFQAAMVDRFSTQGVGLRPRPWAWLCRPVGPGGHAMPGYFA
jgi:hypothetical protein